MPYILKRYTDFCQDRWLNLTHTPLWLSILVAVGSFILGFFLGVNYTITHLKIH